MVFLGPRNVQGFIGGNPRGLGGRDHSVSYSRLFILSCYFFCRCWLIWRIRFECLFIVSNLIFYFLKKDRLDDNSCFSGFPVKPACIYLWCGDAHMTFCLLIMTLKLAHFAFGLFLICEGGVSDTWRDSAFTPSSRVPPIRTLQMPSDSSTLYILWAQWRFNRQTAAECYHWITPLLVTSCTDHDFCLAWG